MIVKQFFNDCFVIQPIQLCKGGIPEEVQQNKALLPEALVTLMEGS